jgi:DNA-binding response OmpR family regulator
MQTMKILVAEDDITSLKILESILKQWGYEVVSARDGLEALKALQAQDSPQLAILDWMMPGMDGPEVCRALRKQDRRDPLYLILLTAKGENGDIVKGLEAGADDYIAKPYINEELQARIDVGRRMIAFQVKLKEREKLQGVLEMAGAVCHELNQPLQVVSAYSEMLLMDLPESDSKYKMLTSIYSGVTRIGELTDKIMRITRYKSRPYLSNGKIVDIERSSQDGKGNDSDG